MPRNKVYIISTAGRHWSAEMEITYVTLSPDKAKKFITKYIKQNKLRPGEEGYSRKENPTKDDIERFANDMISENKRVMHCSDEFPGVNIWVNVVELDSELNLIVGEL